MNRCVRGCCESQAAHYKSVTLNTSVASPRRQAERNESKDMDAYKRLVQSGVQPRKIEGAYELERLASTKHEVEHANVILDPVTRRKVTKAFETAADITTTPTTPA